MGRCSTGCGLAGDVGLSLLISASLVVCRDARSVTTDVSIPLESTCLPQLYSMSAQLYFDSVLPVPLHRKSTSML